MSTLPKFLIGVATSAHQIEGNNFNSDWWHTEQIRDKGKSSGASGNSYELFRQDSELIKDLGCNAYRFSIEWSRIEPVKGQYDQQAVNHYLEVLEDLVDKGITPLVTLHHFTNPWWFEQQGGWLQPEAPQIFAKYLDFLLPQISKFTKYYVTFNEPNVYVFAKYLFGSWYPHKKNFLPQIKPKNLWNFLRHTWKARTHPQKFSHFDLDYSIHRAHCNIITAHKNAYTSIKHLNQDAKVTLSSHYQFIDPILNIFSPVNGLIAWLINYSSNNFYFDQVFPDYLDYLGVNFYSAAEIGVTFQGKVLEIRSQGNLEQGEIFYHQNPLDLTRAVEQIASRYGLPIIITENGFAGKNDEARGEYIRQIFSQFTPKFINKNKLQGYFFWSLLDNYEWQYGYDVQFGLYSIGKNFQRLPKNSAVIFAEQVKSFKQNN